MNSLITTTSRFAIVAAAGMFMGGLALTPAQAADLGGDCCADLEERVAELEATTVRKGNRKVSLKVSGQVNYTMLYWNDGGEDDVYIGDNTESSTRFRFTGAAKFRPGWSAGFLIEIEVEAARSVNFDQLNASRGNGNSGGVISGDHGRRDGVPEGRKMAWYIKSDRLGEVWMGRYSPATDDIKLLNIAGTPNVDASLETGAGFFLRAPGGTGGCAGSGCLYDIRLGALAPGGDTNRAHVIRYNTPSLMGMVFSVAWGDDDIFDLAVRYKKQWNSIQVVGGVGYYWTNDEEDDAQLNCAGRDNRFPGVFFQTGQPAGLGGAATVPFVPGGNNQIQNTSINNPGVGTTGGLLQAQNLLAACRDYRYDLERLAGSFSAMHTPSGLYAYFGGHRETWGSFSTYNESGTNPAINVAGLRTGGGDTEPNDATHWYVQLGMKRRIGPMRNLGATTGYVEYQQWDGWQEGTCGGGGVNLTTACNSPFGPSNANAHLPGGSANNFIIQNLVNAQLGLPAYANTYGAYPTANGTYMTETEVTSWGFGVVQNIDKAAMQVWLGFRKYDPEVRTQTVFNAGVECAAPFPNGTGGCTPHPRQLATQVIHHEVPIEEIWTVSGGGKIKF